MIDYKFGKVTKTNDSLSVRIINKNDFDKFIKSNPALGTIYDEDTNSKEYAEQILEYLAKGSIPARQTHVRLSKHLDEDIADSVVKRLLQVPIKTLRYLGLAYDPADSVGNIPQYLENKTSNPKSDAELDPELA
jgi:hypothetical protein